MDNAVERLLEERHNQIMSAIISIHDRLNMLNGRTRQSEIEIAVLRDRGNRANLLSWSSLGAVIAGAMYWVLR